MSAAIKRITANGRNRRWSRPREVNSIVVHNVHGFQTVTRVDRFIDRPQDEDLWWLIAFRKP